MGRRAREVERRGVCADRRPGGRARAVACDRISRARPNAQRRSEYGRYEVTNQHTRRARRPRRGQVRAAAIPTTSPPLPGRSTTNEGCIKTNKQNAHPERVLPFHAKMAADSAGRPAASCLRQRLRRVLDWIVGWRTSPRSRVRLFITYTYSYSYNRQTNIFPTALIHT